MLDFRGKEKIKRRGDVSQRNDLPFNMPQKTHFSQMSKKIGTTKDT